MPYKTIGETLINIRIIYFNFILTEIILNFKLYLRNNIRFDLNCVFFFF